MPNAINNTMSCPRLIGKWDLMVGQTVLFTESDYALPENLQGPLRVVNRIDSVFDMCRCFLEDSMNQRHDYCPRMNRLHGYNLGPRYKVTVIEEMPISEEERTRIELMDTVAWPPSHAEIKTYKYDGVVVIIKK